MRLTCAAKQFGYSTHIFLDTVHPFLATMQTLLATTQTFLATDPNQRATFDANAKSFTGASHLFTCNIQISPALLLCTNTYSNSNSNLKFNFKFKNSNSSSNSNSNSNLERGGEKKPKKWKMKFLKTCFLAWKFDLGKFWKTFEDLLDLLLDLLY